MRKSGTARAIKYAQFINSDAYYLRVKSMLRTHRVDVSKISAICAEKDSKGKIMIDAFGLGARTKVLAWQAWRELYFMNYRFQQTEVT